MAVSTEQRAFDLLMAGHSVDAVAQMLGIGEAVVLGYAQDLTVVKSPGTVGGVAPAASSPTLVSGTALQDATGYNSTWYIPVTLHAGGSVSIAIGPTSGVAEAIITSDDATLARTHVVELPANWFIKATVAGSAVLGTPIVITHN